jgi:hypothetical protein
VTIGCGVIGPGFAIYDLPVRRWAVDAESRTLQQAHGFVVEKREPDK